MCFTAHITASSTFHMYESLDNPRFVVTGRIVQGNQCFLTWDFDFRLKQRGNAITIHGGSHLQLDPSGHILLHRDYWDAAEELYEKLPLIGALMRWLRRGLRSTRTRLRSKKAPGTARRSGARPSSARASLSNARMARATRITSLA